MSANRTRFEKVSHCDLQDPAITSSPKRWATSQYIIFQNMSDVLGVCVRCSGGCFAQDGGEKCVGEVLQAPPLATRAPF